MEKDTVLLSRWDYDLLVEESNKCKFYKDVFVKQYHFIEYNECGQPVKTNRVDMKELRDEKYKILGQLGIQNELSESLFSRIESFNKKPWYKRLFKKV